jgi:NAD(P)H-quinone oxidoreductase subunit 4
VALCLLVPIIGIGLYPKLATQVYDSKTVQVAGRIESTVLLAEPPATLYTHILRLPQTALANAPALPIS